MKFGKTLLQNEIPEWSKSYLSYKALKKAIKEAGVRLPPSEESTTAILFQLDRELEKVNTFYMYKRSQIDRRFWIVSEKYNQYCKATSYYLEPSTTSTEAAATTTTDQDDTKELVSALQETRAQMRRILWFAEMNAQGFRKILKKLDKKLGLDTQQVYWETKVAQLPFVTQDEIVKNIDTLTQWLSDMSVNDPVSGTSTPASTKYYQTNIIRDLGKHESLAHAIDDDSVDQLKQQLQMLGSGSVDQKFGYAMLERAAIKGSPDCLEYLLSNVKVNPMGRYDINERNLLHKLCIGVRDDWVDDSVFSNAMQTVVQKLLQVAPNLNAQLDCIGRRPLHYAAEFGLAALAHLFLCQAIDAGDYQKDGFADPKWQDREGHTPLFLAILHGNYLTLKDLVETGKIDDIDGIIAAASAQDVSHGLDDNDTVPEYVHRSHHPSATALACNVCNLDLLQLLIAKGASVNLADEDGETALLIAARHHFTEGVRILIEQGHADVNHSDNINGWTALMIAAMEGCTDIVQLLLDHDADKAATDSNGWAAYEHAVFRGYLDIGRMTKPDNIPDRIDTDDAQSTGKNESGKSLSHHALEARSRAGRLYGHKYLTDQSMIIIKLGSNDIRNPASTQFMNLQDTTLEDQRLSIAVSAVNATGELPIVDLPPTNQIHLLDIEPIILSSSNPESVVLRFDLVETFGASHGNNIIARATATLATDQIYTKSRGFKGQAPGNSSLRGQQTVPIIRASTLDFIGTLGFEYFVVTPFTHPNMTVGDRYTYYKSLDTKIIGHRGSGMNQRSSHLQVGENTVLSFITAASLGAEYVEFDVQLTKDLVPVIYHDWTVTETGFDIPLNAITSEQFLNLRPSGHIKEYHTGVSDDHPNGQLSTQPDSRPPIVAPAYESPPSSEDDSTSVHSSSQGKRRAARSNSMSAISSKQMHGRTLASKRLELTRTNKLGKLKGNGPESIHFISQSELVNFMMGRPVLEKQKHLAMFRPSAFYVAQVIMDIPYAVVQVFLFEFCAYFMMGLKLDAGAFFTYFITLFFVNMMMNGLFRMFGAVTSSFFFATQFSGVILIALVTYTGYIIPYPSMHPWLFWIYWMNPLAYGYQNLLINEMKGQIYSCEGPGNAVPYGPGYDDWNHKVCTMTGGVPGQNYVLGDDYLRQQLSYEPSRMWAPDFIVVVAYFLLFTAVCALAMEFLHPEKGGTLIKVYAPGKAPKARTEAEEDERRRRQAEITSKMDNISTGTTFSWHHVNYQVPFKGGPLHLLNDISGIVKPGHLTALMGSSGAGKTTLLDVLARRKTIGKVEGRIYLNGEALMSDFERITGYCEQMDIHQPAITVREAMRFSAYLRQDANVPKAEKDEYVEQIITLLEMEDIADAQIGDVDHGVGISVEERKRLTIGMELVAKPKLLFLDEPTSGLDSQSSFNIVRFIRKLADAGWPVLCTIHQPSSVLFEHFDHLLLLVRGGKTAYYGEIGKDAATMIEYFESNGGPKCSPDANPAEYILEVVGAGTAGKATRDWAEIWANSPQAQALEEELEQIHNTADQNPQRKSLSYATSLLTQFKLVFKRMTIAYWRSPDYNIGRFVTIMCTALINGFTFWKMSTTSSDLQNRLFVLLGTFIMAFTLIILAQPKFMTERLYFRREYASRFYSWLPFAISAILVEIPYIIFYCACFMGGIYWTAGLMNTPEACGFFYIMLVGFVFWAVTLGFVIAAIAESPVMASVINPLIISMLILFAGMMQPPSAMPRFWSAWMYWLDPFHYYIEGLTTNEMEHIIVECSDRDLVKFSPPSGQTCGEYMANYLNNGGPGYIVDENATDMCGYCNYKSGPEYYGTIYQWDAANKWRDLGIIFAFFVFNVFLFIGLCWWKRKGRR